MIKKFFDWKSQNLDERELALRGMVFGRTLGAALVYYLVAFQLEYMGIFKIVQPFGYLIGIVICTAVLAIGMVRYNIYPMGEKRQAAFYIFLGVFSLILAITGIIFAVRGMPLIKDATLTTNGCIFAMGIVYFSIFAAYVARKDKDTQIAEDEDENEEES